MGDAAVLAIRIRASFRYFRLMSIRITPSAPSRNAAIAVVPPPPNGSITTPPGGSVARKQRSASSTGNVAGCVPRYGLGRHTPDSPRVP